MPVSAGGETTIGAGDGAWRRDDVLAQWMARWGDRLVRYAHFLVADPDWAQDIAQEAFLRLYVHLGRTGEEPQVAWLFTVAKNLAHDTRRHRSLSATVADRPDPSVDRALLAATVRDALDRLKPEDRECLYLFYYAQLPTADIAAHLRLPAATVRSRLWRARRRFSVEWQDD